MSVVQAVDTRDKMLSTTFCYRPQFVVDDVLFSMSVLTHGAAVAPQKFEEHKIYLPRFCQRRAPELKRDCLPCLNNKMSLIIFSRQQ